LEPHWFVRTSEILLSDMFSEAGYVTGMFGKWHLGDNYPYGPERRGFDEVLRHYGGAVGVLADYWDNCYVDDTYYRNGKPTKVLTQPEAAFRQTALSQACRPWSDKAPIESMGYSIRTEQYRYTRWVDHNSKSIISEELYDLTSDPFQRSNVLNAVDSTPSSAFG
jgi:arylsulfatase A-like enzyme